MGSCKLYYGVKYPLIDKSDNKVLVFKGFLFLFKDFQFFIIYFENFVDRENGICGNDEVSPYPLSDDCLKLLWNKTNCKMSAFDIDRWRNMRKIEVKSKMQEIRSKSIYGVYNPDGELYRILCYGITSLNSVNVLYKKDVFTPYSGRTQLITDGIRYGIQGTNSCFRKTVSPVSIRIVIRISVLIRKLVIYSPRYESKIKRALNHNLFKKIFKYFYIITQIHR